MKKRITSLLAALVIVLSLCGWSKQSSGGFDRSTLDSVVVVREDIVADGEWVGYGTGTGFFVGPEGEDPQYLVTNYHVIELLTTLEADPATVPCGSATALGPTTWKRHTLWTTTRKWISQS